MNGICKLWHKWHFRYHNIQISQNCLSPSPSVSPFNTHINLHLLEFIPLYLNTNTRVNVSLSCNILYGTLVENHIHTWIKHSHTHTHILDKSIKCTNIYKDVVLPIQAGIRDTKRDPMSGRWAGIERRRNNTEFRNYSILDLKISIILKVSHSNSKLKR